MFKVGDVLVHKNYGILVLTEISQKDFGSGANEYYSLSKMSQNNNDNFKVDILANNCNYLRYPMDKQTALYIVNNLENLDTIWSSDNKERKEIFANIFSEGDPIKIASIAATLRNKRLYFVSFKKNLPISDTKKFEKSYSLIKEELIFVLGEEFNDYSQNVRELLGDF